MAAVGAATTERVLEEVKLEIKNLEEEYEIEDFEEEFEGETIYEKWEKVKEVVGMMGRTSEEEEKNKYGVYVVTTARVELVISDPAVREIGEYAFPAVREIVEYAFSGCVNLWKVKAPFVEEIGSVWGCENLVECGPGKVLSGLLKRSDRSLPCSVMETPEDLELVLRTVANEGIYAQ